MPDGIHSAGRFQARSGNFPSAGYIASLSVKALTPPGFFNAQWFSSGTFHWKHIYVLALFAPNAIAMAWIPRRTNPVPPNAILSVLGVL
jgi:hypothetical protein